MMIFVIAKLGNILNKGLTLLKTWKFKDFGKIFNTNLIPIFNFIFNVIYSCKVHIHKFLLAPLIKLDVLIL